MSVLTAVVRRELLVFARYPSWILSLIIWPVLFPVLYLLGGRALAGPGGEGLPAFVAATGTDNVRGFIVIGTMSWMWLNITLWSVGTSLRTDQVRGTLESNWLTPASRFALLLGTAASQALVSIVLLGVGALEFALVLGVPFQASLPGRWPSSRSPSPGSTGSASLSRPWCCASRRPTRWCTSSGACSSCSPGSASRSACCPTGCGESPPRSR